ncbi:hypothetical protein ACFL1D_04525 [Candidatus Omnitrophota bacterium]
MKKGLVLALAALVFIAFFLPWVSVETGSVVGAVTKMLKGQEEKATLLSISGFQVPVLANSEESRLMISVIKIFQPGITNADKKSYLIWIVPLLAVAMAILGNYVLKNNKWAHLAIGIIGVVIFAGAVFKITTTNLDKAILKVNIAPGLWLVFIAYLGIGILSLLEFWRLLKKS